MCCVFCSADVVTVCQCAVWLCLCRGFDAQLDLNGLAVLWDVGLRRCFVRRWFAVVFRGKLVCGR